METTRSKQELKAAEMSVDGSVIEWHFMCHDGEIFRAVAPSEDGAFRVLNAERPHIQAHLEGSLLVLSAIPSLRSR